jgi:hypothetical protein
VVAVLLGVLMARGVLMAGAGRAGFGDAQTADDGDQGRHRESGRAPS